jgi:hypothetical protein
MIENITMLIGIITICLFGALLILMLIYILYLIIDVIFKRLLGWKDIETRREIIYFIRNKKKIQEYIKNEKL